MGTWNRTMRWVLPALLVGLCGRPEAREVLFESFDALPTADRSAGVEGVTGRGWRQTDASAVVERDLSVADARQGRISFRLKRLAGPRDAKPSTLLELLDGQGTRLLRLQVSWFSEAGAERPAFRIESERRHYYFRGTGLWAPLMPVADEIPEGRWVDIVLAWDDNARRYDLSVDGRPVDSAPGWYDRVAGRFVEDPRLKLNREALGRGEAPVFPVRPFSEFLAEVRRVRVGSRDGPRRPRDQDPALLDRAVIDDLAVTVGRPAARAVRGADNVGDLRGHYAAPGVTLFWSAPQDREGLRSYAVYRRAGEGAGRFQRLHDGPASVLTYRDETPEPGRRYRYSVAAVYSDGQGGSVESRSPPEVAVTASAVSVDSVAADRAAYGGGQEIVITLRGTAGAKASCGVEGVTPSPVAMTEVDDGVYAGKVVVPEGANVAAARLTGTLALGIESSSAPGARVVIDSTPPAAVGNLLASAPWESEVEIAWDPSPSADVDHYALYRADGADPAASGEPFATTRESRLLDTSVVPGLTYHYRVVPVDVAGNAGPASAAAWAEAVGGDGLTSVTAEPAGRTLRPGDILTLAALGRSDGQGAVDLGSLAVGVPLSEQGRTGRYVGTYAVTPEDVAATKRLHRVVARLTDAAGEAASLAGPEVAVVGQDGLIDQTPPAVAAVDHDGRKVVGFCGALVAGDVVTVTARSEPAGSGAFSVPGVVHGVLMQETAEGVYRGSFTVPWGAAGADLPVVVTLADENGNEARARAEGGLTFDTRLRLAVKADKALLPADRRSRARLTAKAENANGAAVEGHELVLSLTTTEEYTGVVGGGAVNGRTAAAEDVDDVEVKWGGVTNHFGEVAADYTAGFAAKTAVLVAKDLTTGDVGVGWLNTYVASTVALELTPRSPKAAEDRAVLRMGADPTKLTADGRSTSRITAWVTDLGGTPLAGIRVAFSLGNENGRLKVLQAVTDAKGVAAAEYRAGTLIGTVTVTASVPELGAAGSVQVTLMADAPAKIDLVASAARLVANGSDTATLSVAVSDVHDNPSAQVPVSFAVLQGAGRVGETSVLTDRNGEGRVIFTAGTTPGPVIVEARHTSRPPNEQELRRICGTVFVPRWSERQERDRMKVGEWLVRPGEAVTRGQTLVTVETRAGTQTLVAPAAGVFVREVRRERDPVELGDTLGFVEIDGEEWARRSGQ